MILRVPTDLLLVLLGQSLDCPYILCRLRLLLTLRHSLRLASDPEPYENYCTADSVKEQVHLSVLHIHNKWRDTATAAVGEDPNSAVCSASQARDDCGPENDVLHCWFGPRAMQPPSLVCNSTNPTWQRPMGSIPRRARLENTKITSQHSSPITVCAGPEPTSCRAFLWYWHLTLSDDGVTCRLFVTKLGTKSVHAIPTTRRGTTCQRLRTRQAQQANIRTIQDFATPYPL